MAHRRIFSLVAVLAVVVANALCVCEIRAMPIERSAGGCPMCHSNHAPASPATCRHCDASAAPTIAQPDAGFVPAMPLLAIIDPISPQPTSVDAIQVVDRSSLITPPPATLFALHCALIR